MSRSLAPICLLPPSLDTAWKGLAPPAATHQVPRRGDGAIEVATPLFWFDPPWHRLAIETADALATAVANCGITVSALRRDLAPPEATSRFFEPSESIRAETGPQASRPTACSRLLPYRPERYGLSLKDFQGSGIIDLRLAVGRDETGAHAFSQQQIQRWEAALDATPVAGGGWVPAATFPPDVISLEHLGSKILQLRKLAPSAAVFVSLGPFRVAEEIGGLLVPHADVRQLPDGVIVRFDQAGLTPLQLAQQTRRVRACIDAAGQSQLPLWVVPGSVSADDAAKLVALGASGVAVDAWCLPLIEELSQPAEASSAGYEATQRGVVISNVAGYAQLTRWVTETLQPRADRFLGLCRSIHPDPEQRLGSFDREWAESLGIAWLGS